MATYITAVGAGPCNEVLSEQDGIPLGLYCRQSLAQYLDPDEIFEVTRQGFGFFHQAFGVRYPFGKYDQLFVPEYKAGAMENAGCVTFLEDYIFRSRVTESERETRAETILHEMAHMWFGDLVTMRWWDDLWLNESFATWAGTIAQAEATRWTAAWTTFAQLYKAWAYRQDQRPSAHPIPPEIPDMAAARHPGRGPHRIAIGSSDYGGGRRLARRHRVEADIVGERTELPELTGHRQPDLVLVNDDDLSYAKMRLDSSSMRFLLGNIGEFADPLPAALCWAAAWDMCRDAELAARHYVGLVNEGVDSVTEISVLQTLLRQASAAVRRYADPAWRDEGLAQMASATCDLMHPAEPGSDRQLSYLHAFAGVATGQADLTFLAGLLDGSAALDGLTVDTE